MKKSQIVSYVISLLVFVVLLVSLSNILTPVAPRLPSENYLTLEEEYIDAIEHFNNTGDVFVPDGARFSCDNKQITITDINSGAYVSCKFVLNGTVPVYSYTYEKSVVYLVLSLIISVGAMFACNEGLNSYFNKKKYRALNKLKKNATYGDDRRNSSDCLKCYKKEHCKCIQCPYVTDCGRCPSSDCEDIIEDMLQEHIKNEKDAIDDDDILEETSETCECDECSCTEDASTTETDTQADELHASRCEDCIKFASCECDNCKHLSVCKECPHENCVEEFESEHVQEKKDAAVHTLDGSKGDFECTPNCSNFDKCECMQDCSYVQECHSCPYPGCTHDIQKELLGMSDSKDTSDD